MATKKNTLNSGASTNDTTIQTVNVLLKDGTALNVVLNGSTYESKAPISDGVLTEDNLSSVKIDGEPHENMILVSKYPYQKGTRFVIRDMTDNEKMVRDLREQLAVAEQSIAEMTVLISTLSAGAPEAAEGGEA